MKHSLTLIFAILSLARGAMAQEAFPLDEAQRIAQKLASVPTAASDLPFTIDIDVNKPVGMKGDDAGFILLPDKNFSADSVANAGKTVTPVAQLWTYHVNLANNGISVENAKLRTLALSDENTSRDVQLFLIGVAKNEQGAPELVVFGKGTEPVLRVPLAKNSAGIQDFPIEISGRKTSEDSAVLTLNLTGQYTADLAVVKAGN